MMKLPEMRTDIRPHCDIHPHTEMLLAPLIRKEAGGRSIVYAFACAVPGCARLFDTTDGYHFSKPDGHTDPDSKKFVACPTDQQAMYIAEFNLRTRDVLWQCSDPACEGSTIASARH